MPNFRVFRRFSCCDCPLDREDSDDLAEDEEDETIVSVVGARAIELTG